MTETIRRVMWVIVLCAALPLTPPMQADARDWPMYNHDVIGTRHNPGETALDRSTCRAARGEMAISRQGFEREDRSHSCHARRRQRLRLLRDDDRPDVLQADARRQGPLVVPIRPASRSTGRASAWEDDSLPAVGRRNHGLGAGHR